MMHHDSSRVDSGCLIDYKLSISFSAGHRYKKKISAKRLLVNAEHADNHVLWTKFGMGLADSNGALKRELIHLTDPPDSTISETLLHAFHGDAEEISQALPGSTHGDVLSGIDELPNVEARTCCSRFGHCVQEPFHEAACAFAQEFAKQIQEKNLPTGTLVQLSAVMEHGNLSTGSQQWGTFLLGAFCKKPLVQVLCRTQEDPSSADTVSLQLDQSGVPCFVTTHSHFLELLQRGHARASSSAQQTPPFTEVLVEVFACNFVQQLFSLQHMQVHVLQTTHKFKIGSGKKSAGQGQGSGQKPKVELPFGLQLPKRPRKKKAGPAQKGNKKETHKQKVAAHVTDLGSAASANSDSDAGAAMSSSSSSSSSSLSRNKSSPGSEAEPAGDLPKDTEPELGQDLETIAAPTKTVEKEEREVAKECKEFDKTVAKKQEIAKKFGEAKSFFVQTIGFTECSMAVSNRSVCYHCNAQIPKGEARFTYFYSRTRPSRYIHASCVRAFVAAEPGERRAQAIETMQSLATSLASSSSSSCQVEAVHFKSIAQDLLSQLQNDAAEAT